MPGITGDDGQCGLDLLDLLDAVLQHQDDGGLCAQAGQPAGRVVVLGGLDPEDRPDRRRPDT